MWEYSGVDVAPQLQDWMRRAIEEISYNMIQNYMNNKFEFVDVTKGGEEWLNTEQQI